MWTTHLLLQGMWLSNIHELLHIGGTRRTLQNSVPYRIITIRSGIFVFKISWSVLRKEQKQQED